MSPQWEALAAQWRANRRLRIGIGVAALVALLHVALSRSDAVEAAAAEYRSDRALLQRLEGAAADAAWTTRADEAESALAALEAEIKSVAGNGEAQAELQALLNGAATAAGIGQPTVRTEAAVELDGLPGVLEVSGRLAGATTAASTQALLADLAARPWVRVERVDLRDGAPGDVQMIVRGYFRRASADTADDVAAGAAP